MTDRRVADGEEVIRVDVDAGEGIDRDGVGDSGFRRSQGSPAVVEHSPPAAGVDLASQCITLPAVTLRSSPVIRSAASEQRKATASPMSSGWTSSCRGACCSASSLTAS